MTITIYGIRACDTMKKARDWLEAQGVEHAFHDYKSQGIERAQLEGWTKLVDWELLLNRAGTTFRKLSDADKQDIDCAKAIDLMLAHPSLIKRPVLDMGGKNLDSSLLVGFKPDVYAKALG